MIKTITGFWVSVLGSRLVKYRDPRTKHRQAGFTLVEMLIAVLLITVVIGAMGMVYTSSYKLFNSIARKTTIQADAAFILEHMSRKILLAKDINGLDQNPDGTYKRIEFQNPNDKWSEYQLVGKKIQYRTLTTRGGAQESIEDIGDNCQKLSFAITDKLIVGIKMEFMKDNEKINIETKIASRNKAANTGLNP